MKIVDFLKKIFLPQPEYGYVINRRNKKPKKKPKIKKIKVKKQLKIKRKLKPPSKPAIKTTPAPKAKKPKKETPNKKTPIMLKKPEPATVKVRNVGLITHYFDKISVGVIKLDSPLRVGDKIRIKGNSGEFVQDVASMQINRKDIHEAKKGDDIGIKLIKKANVGDVVTLE